MLDLGVYTGAVQGGVMDGKAMTVLALIPLLGACAPGTWFSDDVDLELNFSLLNPLTGPSDTLHTPYVQGARVRLHAHDSRDRGNYLDGCWLESSDEDVLLLSWPEYSSDGDLVSTDAEAIGEGTAELRLIDADGRVLDTTEVEVRFPSHVELHAAGPLFVDHPDMDPATEDPAILTGGLATFQVRYFDGDQRLFGNGTLGAIGGGDIGVDVDQTYLFENREWLRLSPDSDGWKEVGLTVAGRPLQEVHVEGVLAEDIESLEIFGSSEVGARDEEWMVLLAQAFDTRHEPVFGVEYAWDVDGQFQWGYGDLYRYEYDPSSPVVATAWFDGLEVSAPIHADHGYVDSSNDIGCDTAALAPWTSGLVVMPLLWGRRRRRRNSGS